MDCLSVQVPPLQNTQVRIAHMLKGNQSNFDLPARPHRAFGCVRFIESIMATLGASRKMKTTIDALDLVGVTTVKSHRFRELVENQTLITAQPVDKKELKGEGQNDIEKEPEKKVPMLSLCQCPSGRCTYVADPQSIYCDFCFQEEGMELLGGPCCTCDCCQVTPDDAVIDVVHDANGEAGTKKANALEDGDGQGSGQGEGQGEGASGQNQ